jgi:hypothetical protein
MYIGLCKVPEVGMTKGVRVREEFQLCMNYEVNVLNFNPRHISQV